MTIIFLRAFAVFIIIYWATVVTLATWKEFMDKRPKSVFVYTVWKRKKIMGYFNNTGSKLTGGNVALAPILSH